MNAKLFILSIIFTLSSSFFYAQKPAIIAYYDGDAAAVEHYDFRKISHVIYSFGHLNGNKFILNKQKDSLAIQKLVAQKKLNPKLKVMLSLGGWGGCETCSQVFNTQIGRTEFATSLKASLDFFKADGIDLDWEYPAIEGFPGHQYLPEDKQNFTALVVELRKTLGKEKIISFAAGGLSNFLENSIEWKKVVPYLNFINIMTYDLVHGYSLQTGHHALIYSTKHQKESVDYDVQYLLKAGIPASKLVIGAAFYGRIFQEVENINNGLDQKGKFLEYIPQRNFQEKGISTENGYQFFWDDKAKAPFAYNKTKKLFATFDNEKSLKLKTEYVKKHKLYGIMFWNLSEDTPNTTPLLNAVYQTAVSK